jgi:MFS family permease
VVTAKDHQDREREGDITQHAAARGEASEQAAKSTFRDVFGVAEFRALWLAQLLSVAGDQLARVALTVLVYDRTHSALLTALTYALTYLPWIVGGLVLSGLGDNRPRRQVMVACDVARAGLVVIMALPGSPIWLMAALLFVVTLLDSPFKSARAALFPDILEGDRYVLGNAIAQLTIQVGTVAGYAVGGVIVAFLGVRTALLADAATFVASGLLVGFGVRKRLAARADGRKTSPVREIAAGVRLVFGDRHLRILMPFGWLVAFYVVPESLAVPYATEFHGAHLAVAAGLVFASGPLGTALGAAVFGRLVSQERRLRWMGSLAIGTCGTLILCLLRPDLPVSLAIFVISGACGCYQLAANAAFVGAVPNDRRSQAFGLANGGMQVSQGLWFVLAGAIAEAVGPATAIALSGVIGMVIAAVLSVAWYRR